jgi:hypothetical protein
MSSGMGIHPGVVLAVKIDNTDAARPATGLGDADVIYVEPVEGGLTRIVAVFSAHDPATVGPVRSARRTDIDLLAQYGKPTLSYSGAAPNLLPLLHSASLVNASPTEVSHAFFRGTTHAPPHNLYVRPARLPSGSGPTPTSVLDFGSAPAGGTPTSSERVGYQAATYQFAWSASTGRWLVTMNGTAYRTTDSGQLGAATVVVQRVSTHQEAWPEDSSGAHAPVVASVGSGAVTVLRDGQAFQGTWSRPSPNDPTRFTTSGGQALPLASGPVWIMLVPA